MKTVTHQMGAEPIRNDPFIAALLKKIPTDERAGFSDRQLTALKAALGGRAWGAHVVDLRWTIGFWRYNYYLVILAGRNRRQLTRVEQRVALMVTAMLLIGFATCSALFGLLLLYLIKSAVGIDLFPGFSLGIWGWFKDTFQMLL